MTSNKIAFCLAAALVSGCGTPNSSVSENPDPVPVQAPAVDDSKAHFDQGFAYIGAAQIADDVVKRESLYRAAEIELTKAIDIRRDYADAYLNRGVLYLAIGKQNKAETDLIKAKELAPDNADVSYNLACLYSVAGKLDLAIDALDTALQQGFNNSDRLRSDPDLAAVRRLKEFTKVLERHKFFIS